MNQTLRDEHLHLDHYFLTQLSGYLFAESVSEYSIVAHTLSGNYRYSVKSIEKAILEGKAIHELNYRKVN